ncbi:hypothetical protein [Sphingomonas aracearum]|uniref:Uncharacterized protein n=1 Tax=Sphingomonas aracearum TaxID=2283317 RepID=A0A369VY10_9SPHN|nr:hypothetical protein [Sphingomonas aracearum]RDE04721.1 hypothetical protein DVW87_14150 [Sphingomonas aracearum]
MEPVYFVMAILGCGDASQGCQQARVEPAHYASAAQCQAAMPAALARNTDLDYPEISAACRSSGLQMTGTKSARRAG